MALRDKITAGVTPHLQPGEELQAVFGAQTRSQWMMPLVGFLPFILFNRYRVVAATDRRIAVFDSGVWGIKNARELVYEIPRATTLGPGSGMWHRIETGPERLRVHFRFFKDLAEADRLSGVAPGA
jgi:hypothetical protein